jgi:hypothetical protein
LVLAVPVVAWGLSEMASLTPADQHIGRYLPNLATVLHRPISRLNEIRELTPIGRVRRPARGAEARLAGHSEDWHRRRFRSVEPKRLLARRLELDHDLYENRVAVALADPQLPRYLVRRLAEIERLEQAYGDALEAVNVGSHHRRRRIFSLWSEEFADAGAVADARDQARTTATYLRSLMRRVYALRGAPLASELRGRRPPGRTLRLTNALVSDQHYRRVATLWREVVEHQTRPRSDRERMAQLQRRHRAMAGFVASLVARNLDTLGYRPGDDDVAVDAGTGPIWLTGPWGQVSFAWDRDDVVTLTNGERTTRLVPVACDLRLLAEERGLESTEPVVLVSGDEVVVHLAPSTGSPGQMSDDAVVGSGSAVAVSPVEATSLERVGRHVFRTVAVAPLRAYPPALRPGGERVPARLRPLLAEFAPFEEADEQLWLRRPLDAVTQQDLAVFRERLERAGRGFGWERDHLTVLPTLVDAIAAADRQLRVLLTCLLCGTQNAERVWEVRGGRTFWVACACGVGWGTVRCGGCARVFPVFDQPALGADLHVVGPGWSDRVVGRDALATPCEVRSNDRRRSFICPACGDCGAARSARGRSCVRCSGRVVEAVAGG